jgi:hypothetical protein
MPGGKSQGRCGALLPGIQWSNPWAAYRVLLQGVLKDDLVPLVARSWVTW